MKLQLGNTLIVFIIILSSLLSGCTRVLLSIYGLNLPEERTDEEVIAYANKYNVDLEHSFFINSSYHEEYYDTALMGCSEEKIMALTQPLQLRIFNNEDKLVAFMNNCYCGGFPNLDWNSLGIFDSLLYPVKQLWTDYLIVD